MRSLATSFLPWLEIMTSPPPSFLPSRRICHFLIIIHPSAEGSAVMKTTWQGQPPLTGLQGHRPCQVPAFCPDLATSCAPQAPGRHISLPGCFHQANGQRHLALTTINTTMKCNQAETSDGLAEHFPRSRDGLMRSVEGQQDQTDAERRGTAGTG